ncbi:MAG: hypothetical protein LBL83_12490 [Clostridiales bacterium]|nr:hypothetical protein [Clostridiales bacterium]
MVASNPDKGKANKHKANKRASTGLLMSINMSARKSLRTSIRMNTRTVTRMSASARIATSTSMTMRTIA